MKRIFGSNGRKVTLKRAFCYGLPDIMGGGGFTIIGAFLLFFFTTFAGLTATEGALIIGIARVVDAISSLIIGSITDNFWRTILGKKFGRRHFFLLIGAPLMLEYILMWIPGRGFYYYLVVYLLWEIIAAMVLIPWETLPTEMTNDYDSRVKLSSVRLFISSTGTFLATFIPGQIISFMGQNNKYAYLVNGIIFAIIFVICIYSAYFATWERPINEVEINSVDVHENKWIAVKKQLRDYAFTMRIKTFRKHIFIYLLSFTGKDTFNTIFVYFIVSCMGLTATDSANILSLSIIGIPTTILAGFLMIKKGPKFLFVNAYTIMIFMILADYLVYKTGVNNPIIWLLVIGLIYQIGRQTLEFTPWNVFPLIPDLDEIVTCQHREGLYAAVMTFVRKSTVAVATVIVGIILDESGYIKGTKYLLNEPESAKKAIVGILVFGAGGLIFLALLESLTFKLNKQTHEVVTDEIKRLKSGGKKIDVDEKTKNTVEELTGWKYEKVWNKDNGL
ncbi:MAG: MFS transporter [Liquorilactobacillus nagelii]|jgi:oligogalacturonide transporter|uniref:MFS transporter n=1 Tax=Liquorilactobacillus nagelii TaxID=82688 RepID=UPI002430F7F6|nr:MFS transporter [Liquorilactobacillus nagelii]MCI1634107.1 MFS transporter [Liquorilactobacillus nagelii]